MTEFEKAFGVPSNDPSLRGASFLARRNECYRYVGVHTPDPLGDSYVVLQCAITDEIYMRSEMISWGAYNLMLKPEKGKLIYIEGVDSVGKATQTRLLAAHLRSLGKYVVTLTYPNYGKPIGQIIKRYLNGEFGEASTIHPELISCAYALDRAKDSSFIKQALEDGHWVILDRSPYSNSAFQGGKLDHEDGMVVARHLAALEFDAVNFPKPDKVFFLDAKPSIAMELMASRSKHASVAADGKKDQHESNHQLLDSAYGIYKALCEENSEWEGIPIIDTQTEALRTPEAISKEIQSFVSQWIK